MSKKLLESSSSSEEEEDESHGFKVNEDFAKVFNKYREKEEFQRLKSKYGEEAATSKLKDIEDQENDSSDSESEDDLAEKWTDDHEKDFFKALAKLKRKDSKIYDGKTSFFKPVTENKSKSSKADKPITLVDLERKVMTEKDGEFEELADESLAKKLEDKTYVQELHDIKKSLQKATYDDSESEDDFLMKRDKSETEKNKDEEDYRKWLIGQQKNLDNEEDEAELKNLKDYWNNDQLDDGEKFLRDYILNKRYLDNSDDEDVIKDEENLSDDGETLEKQAEFEHKFNFRFEDPDKDFIKRYPRTIEDSMRRKDQSRKEKRDEIKDRKIREKEKKREELMQLKALKRKEIIDKIDQLRKITGNDTLAFKDEDLEEDFDPDKYDERMTEIFDQFENAPFQAEDEERPVFSDLESDLEPENWDEYGAENEGIEDDNDEAEENDEQQDDDNEVTKEAFQDELIEASKGRKKSKKKSKFAETLEAKKPVFDPNDKKFEEYLDEYYQLDYEDVIGDLPCRFKYRKVAANDLGLSTEEILSAPDRELNAWASLKKTCQYRSEEEEKRDIEEFSKKKNNVNLKKKVLPSLFAEDTEVNLEAEQEKKAGKSKKRRRKRKGQDKSSAVLNLDVLKNVTENSGKRKAESTDAEPKAKRTRNKNKNKMHPGDKANKSKKVDVNKELAISDNRLQHYGLNPNQFKRKVRKQIYKQKNAA